MELLPRITQLLDFGQIDPVGHDQHRFEHLIRMPYQVYEVLPARAVFGDKPVSDGAAIGTSQRDNHLHGGCRPAEFPAQGIGDGQCEATGSRPRSTVIRKRFSRLGPNLSVILGKRHSLILSRTFEVRTPGQ